MRFRSSLVILRNSRNVVCSKDIPRIYLIDYKLRKIQLQKSLGEDVRHYHSHLLQNTKMIKKKKK